MIFRRALAALSRRFAHYMFSIGCIAVLSLGHFRVYLSCGGIAVINSMCITFIKYRYCQHVFWRQREKEIARHLVNMAAGSQSTKLGKAVLHSGRLA